MHLAEKLHDVFKDNDALHHNKGATLLSHNTLNVDVLSRLEHTIDCRKCEIKGRKIYLMQK